MATLLRKPETKEEIRKTLVWIHGSLARASLKHKTNFPVFRNVVHGVTSYRGHLDLVSKINAETGADMTAWEK